MTLPTLHVPFPTQHSLPLFLNKGTVPLKLVSPNYLDISIVAQTVSLRVTPAQTNGLCYKCPHIFRFFVDYARFPLQNYDYNR